ncbi:unnamed protein product [Phaedon cochleariae]|uniref:Uncharacterized protein n=1 Tax=Phaedon cochleariae TaxID=80249 RepID=A0A9N9SGC8_PHACE|nr:unnamed protein product [Phaedon cochleariae]
MDESETPLDEFEVFKDAIKEEDLEVQIKMMKQLGSLAKHLGEELTRDELIPFIQENIDFHDEILLNLSEQLEQFIPLVGGYEHSQSVLDLLRKLCHTDEEIVINKTVETMKTIALGLNSDLTEKLFVPMVEAMASEDLFTICIYHIYIHKHITIILYVFQTIYSKVKEETKIELRHSFRVLVQDESPIVRKKAASILVDLIFLLEKDCLRDEFIPVFDNISKDSMDFVRTMLMRIAIALCKNLTESEIEEFVFATVESCADDTSWNIRLMLAHHIGEVQENIPFGKMRGKILAMYQKLINDIQDEVRVEAVNNLSSYCQNLKKSYETTNSVNNNFEAVFQQSIVPHLKRLANDPNENVRLAFSTNIIAISSIVGENCFKEDIMPIIEHILEQDSCMDIQENILQRLHSLPAYVDLTESSLSIKIVVRKLIFNSHAKWRTRRSLLVAFLHIANTATGAYFSDNLKMFYATLLGDPVFAVRRTAPVILPLLAKQYGIEWATDYILPFFRMFVKDCRYLYRYIPLFGINELMNPSVRLGQKETYLNDLRHIIQTSNDDADKKKVAAILTRIARMIDTLKYKLEDTIYRDILTLNESIDDFTSDNIMLYADECVTTIKTNCNCNIFAIENKSMLDQRIYLDGLLAVIIIEYLQIIRELFDDPIVNVQIRSIHALNKIKEFTSKIDDELKETWVSEAVDVLTAEEKEQIEKLVDSEMDERPKMISKEDIDTQLMEDDRIDNNFEDSPDDKTDLHDRKIPEIKVEAVDDQVSIVDETEIINSKEENGSLELIEKPQFEISKAHADEIWNSALKA